MEDSSNNEVGSQINESTESETTSNSNESTTNSNGNFSGGFDSSALSNDTFSTDSVPDFGIDFGSNNNSGSFDYNPFDDSGFDLDFGSNNDSGSSDYNPFDESEPVMTVDEVYGKGNQSIVESQGDYTASSNEKSNVETSTVGKQAEISVTPTSAMEDKGTVKNDTIQHIEGLNFQQKDKASQDVLEAKKNRDEAEAKDKANQMRDSLLANIGRPIGKQGDGDVSKFQLGNRDEDLAKAKADVDRLTNEKTKYESELRGTSTKLRNAQNEADALRGFIDKEDADYQAKKANAEQLNAIGQKINSFEQRYQELANKEPNLFNRPSIQKDLKEISSDLRDFKSQLGVDATVAVPNAYQAKEAFEAFQSWKETFAQEYFDGLKDFSPNSITAYKAGIDAAHIQRLQEYSEKAEAMATEAKELENRQKELQALIADNEKKSTEAKTVYDNLVSRSFVGAEEKAPAVTPNPKVEEKTPVTTTPKSVKNATPDINQGFDNAIQKAIEKGADEETVQAMTTAATNIKEAREAVEQAIERDDIPAYLEAQKQLSKRQEEALEIGNALTQTDLKKDFVTAVAKANDFEVPLADGTKKDYSQFATEMVTKSPKIAEAMYEAKAKRLEEDKHPILAKIERAKAWMAGTWLGSKLTFADNQVRNQFNQMVETNMRATYAAYNNVVNDKTGKYSDEQKAEAFGAINQANALKVASTALKASTGFWSGIGDSMKDGVYGTTDPKTLNAWQKTLNTTDNLARITLGLGASPAANKAYQNMYYMAGAKVNESGLFNKDWDGDGFALCQEYGNNAAVGMIAGVGELATGVALFFNPSTTGTGINLVVDSIKTFTDGLYGVQKDVRKSQRYTQEVVSYFEEAKDIAEQSGNKEAVDAISDGITQIENFELKSDEVGNLNNWLEGSGSNTTDNGKFNQSLSYDEWLKLIEADPTMRDYAKKLIAEKKEK